MDNNIKVTIGVPIYNVEKYIEKCSRSLFEQTYQNLEYIFVDDCTKDRSIEVLKKILDDYPNRESQVKIIKHEENRGLGAARNTIVANASGDFITWVDSDDWIDSTMIEKMVQKQVKDDSDIVTVNTLIDWGTNQSVYLQPSCCITPHDWLMVLAKRERKTMIWSRLIRLSLYKDNNIKVLEGCDMGEDHQVIPRLTYYCNKMSLVEEPLYIYNKSNNNAYTANFSDVKANQILRGHELLFHFFNDKEQEYLNALQIGYAKQLSDLALQCCRYGKFDYYNTELKWRINKVPKWCYNEIPWSLRLVLYMKNPHIISLYSRLGHIVRHIKD